ncbi:type VI secretion system tube protein Hcp [Terrabacter sp. Ter38]|uniref:Hcp family type VI secretion system effector n=1 Tax=Terrabacter sp. Ter38 TaxID=2926030 RepID=UPI00211858FB|nr:type VI secretion system tube protein Hcp [Terrabacter sp. Ter38]
MKFDGIDGSSQSKDHKGAIDVVSWNWGVTTQTNGSGGGGGSGRARAHEFRIVHRYDLASPRLASFAATGKHLKDATLNVAHPGARKDFLTVTMKDLVVTEVLVSGEEDDVDEEVALQPAWIRFDYAEPGPGGGATGRTSSVTWDIRSNKMG